jgi:hypothetical protein
MSSTVNYSLREVGVVRSRPTAVADAIGYMAAFWFVGRVGSVVSGAS